MTPDHAIGYLRGMARHDPADPDRARAAVDAVETEIERLRARVAELEAAASPDEL